MEKEIEKILSECLADGVPIKTINYKGLFVPETYEDIAESIENFEVRDDDVWVCSFPKTGTTWTQEMVWGISNDIHSDAAKVILPMRFPFIEFTGTTTIGWVSLRKSREGTADFIAQSVKYAAGLPSPRSYPSPRFLKTHLPYHLLPRQLRTGEKKNKIVYVVRDPKDVCISFYHHYKLLEGYVSTYENFLELFLADKVYFAPFWDHVIGYWNKKDNKDILFLKYEDMKADLSSAIKRTANFLNKPLNDQKLQELEEHLSFANMKANPALNNAMVQKEINESKTFGNNFTSEGAFIRKGTAGQWKTEMTVEVISRFDRWTDEKLKDWPELRKEFS